MKITLVLALTTALGLGACDKKKEAAGAGGAGAKAGTAAAIALDAPAPPVVDAPPAAIDKPTGPFTMPTTATVVPENQSRKPDATALGPAVSVRLVEKVEAADDSVRRVGLAVVLAGAGEMIVELAPAMDQGSKYTDRAAHLRTVAPLTPPRAFAAGDPGAKLAFTGPLLYVGGYQVSDGPATALAVAQDGDALVVWRSEALPEEGEEAAEFEAWYEASRIKLAAGARISTAK